jgi:hypothetical protein
MLFIWCSDRGQQGPGMAMNGGAAPAHVSNDPGFGAYLQGESVGHSRIRFPQDTPNCWGRRPQRSGADSNSTSPYAQPECPPSRRTFGGRRNEGGDELVLEGSILCLVFSEQFPRGVCTISSNNPRPSASNPDSSPDTHDPPCL